MFEAEDKLKAEFPEAKLSAIELDVGNARQRGLAVAHTSSVLQEMESDKKDSVLSIINNAGNFVDGWSEKKLKDSLITNAEGPLRLIEDVLEAGNQGKLTGISALQFISGHIYCEWN